MQERLRAHVLVQGLVQGVFFRATCAREAERHGVAGWVSNRSDGRVEAVFEGSGAAVRSMVSWCRTGPPHARVDDVMVAEESPEGLVGFVVRGRSGGPSSLRG